MTKATSPPAEVSESSLSPTAPAGSPPEDYVESRVEEASGKRDRVDLLAKRSFDEILAPVRRNVEESALSNDEVEGLFAKARQAASRARRERPLS